MDKIQRLLREQRMRTVSLYKPISPLFEADSCLYRARFGVPCAFVGDLYAW